VQRCQGPCCPLDAWHSLSFTELVILLNQDCIAAPAPFRSRHALCMQSLRAMPRGNEKSKKKKELRQEDQKRARVQNIGKARFTTNIVVRPLAFLLSMSSP
jgi:hypothetical protein